MIAAMKQISLSFDIDASASKDDNKINYNLAVLQIPSFFSQFAFVFDPTTLIFGPFITYAQFLEMKCNLRQELREFNYASGNGWLFFYLLVFAQDLVKRMVDVRIDTNLLEMIYSFYNNASH
uniref:Uncharacterized protein n=1 Tax=Meloidogyne hapla TaxID=6305 RepID=A0A1I8BN68_MELHA